MVLGIQLETPVTWPSWEGILVMSSLYPGVAKGFDVTNKKAVTLDSVIGAFQAA